MNTFYPFVASRLRSVRDPNQEALDGRTLEGRMQSLMKQVAHDIIACSEACEDYSKKTLPGTH
jgi:hypothetical protein